MISRLNQQQKTTIIVIICIITDVDECLGDVCLIGQLCTNLVGSYKCEYTVCEEGFFRNFTSGQCEDINECLNEQVCNQEQQCINKYGSYECQYLPCMKGFKRNEQFLCEGNIIKKLFFIYLQSNKKILRLFLYLYQFFFILLLSHYIVIRIIL